VAESCDAIVMSDFARDDERIENMPDNIQSCASREGADLNLKRFVVRFRWQDIGPFLEERIIQFLSFLPEDRV
jgi:hypothetical protein